MKINVFNDIRSLTKLSRPDFKLFYTSVFFLFLSSLFEGVSMALIIPFFDMLVKKGDYSLSLRFPIVGQMLSIHHFRFRNVFFILMASILLCVILKNITVFISELSVSEMNQNLEHDLRTKIFARYFQFSKSFFDSTKIGGLCDLATSEVAYSCEAFRYIHNFVLNALTTLVYFGIMAYISWQLTLVTICMLPIIYFLIQAISRKIMLSAQQKFESDQLLSSSLYDALSNVSIIRSYSTEEKETEKFRAISLTNRNTVYSIWKKIFFAPHAQDIFQTLIMMILITICIFIFLKGEILGFSFFLSFFIVLRRFSVSVNQLGPLYAEISKSAVSINKILWFFDDSDKAFIKDGAAEFGGIKREIRFCDVSFSHKGQPILKTMNLAFPKGKMTAIVGPTGAGKTTIINLILRFYDPVSGTILVDGNDLRSFRLKSLRDRIALVEQDFGIFNATLRSNLAYGFEGKLTDDILDDVVKKTHLWDLVNVMPQRYDTVLGDKGVRLSGGEKQRVAIARAILKNPDLLIFDEATSALDVETESIIQQAIMEFLGERTVIVVAHRLSTIRHADHIAVIENGQIVEQGNFSDLISANGRFKAFWEMQGTAAI